MSTTVISKNHKAGSLHDRPRQLYYLAGFIISTTASNNAGANGTAAFANSEAKTFFNGDRSNKFYFHLYVIARHYHFYTFWQRQLHRLRQLYGNRTVDGSR